MKVNRSFGLALLGAVACVGGIGISVVIADKVIDGRVEHTLEKAQVDFYDTFQDTITYMLAFTAKAVADALGAARPYDRATMDRYARTFAIDELNVADTNGVWIASTDPLVVGRRLDRSPKTAEFLRALAPDRPMISQDFRLSAANAAVKRKYVGLAFADGSGIVQVGYDDSRLARDFDRFYGMFADAWDIGDRRFYIIARADGRLFGCGRPTAAKTLDEIGFDGISFPTDPGQTFSVVTFGERCRARSQLHLGYRFITLLPESEHSDLRLAIVGIPTALLLILYVLLAFVYRSVSRARVAEQRQVEDVAKRRQEDLSVAQTIQLASLPTVFPPFPRDLMIDLYASMEPARDVGGDFYDFLHVAPELLAVIIADVSGKGIPAAMFMMKAKAVIRSLLLSVNDLGEVARRANDSLYEENAANMFVTCWIGVLNERTGELRYVNAGHNPPVLRSADGETRWLDSVSGMALGAWENMSYRVFSKKLKRGDVLYLYTDGVTEAQNTAGEMFGEGRLKTVLDFVGNFEKSGQSIPTQGMCQEVGSAVRGFVGSAGQSDDITMLALAYRGLPAITERDFAVDAASVPSLSDYAEEMLAVSSCPEAIRRDLMVSLDEIVSNVICHSGATRMTIRIEAATDPSVWRFTLSDDGKAWNPLAHVDPNEKRSVEERLAGGLGLFMVQKLMDDLSYDYVGGRNVFRFRKMT